MKIAMIGANGQLGFDLVKSFKNNEHEIVPLVRRPMFSPLISNRLKKHALEMERWEIALENYLIEKGHLK